MANVNGPTGFRPVKHGTGGVVQRSVRYHINTAYAANMAVGDLVEPNPGINKVVQRPAAVTDRLIGVFNGCYYLDPNQSQPQYNRLWPANQVTVAGSNIDCWVFDDPKAVFEVQVSGAFAFANIGKLANPILGAENLFTKTSADAIDSTTIGTGATLKILDIINRPDISVGNFARVQAQIALHYLGGGLTAS